MKQTLNIAGCGKVAQVLARLWTQNRVLDIQDILNRSPDSARQAAAFIGAGRPVPEGAAMRSADIYLIGTPDDRIAATCEALAGAGKFTEHSVVFHCSGALRSSALQAATRCGAAVASVHPVRSFAVPETVAAGFAGTCCGIEGDQRALAVLEPAFAAIGARLLPIKADAKILYHAAAVFASNYLVTLLDVAMQAYVEAGIPEDAALALMEPLVRETVDNVFRLGTMAALTGPIARGDTDTALRQQQAVASWDARHGALYEIFIELTAALAQRRKSG